MGMNATLAYKNDDGELIAAAASGNVYGIPEATSSMTYGEKVAFIDKAAKRGGFKVGPDLQLNFILGDSEFDPEWDTFTALDIFGIVENRSDVDFFVKDSGETVKYDARQVVKVDTALL